METYAISLRSCPEGPPIVVSGANRDKAKYQAFLDTDGVYAYFFDFMRDIASMRLVSRDKIYATEAERDNFARFAARRGIPFAEIGMDVKVAGEHGVIMGSNSSANLDVLFDDGQVKNCHPMWNITYCEKNGAVVSAFSGE